MDLEGKRTSIAEITIEWDDHANNYVTSEDKS